MAANVARSLCAWYPDCYGPVIVVTVPFGLRLVAVDLNRRTVDIEGDGRHPLATPLGSDAAPGQLPAPPLAGP